MKKLFLVALVLIGLGTTAVSAQTVGRTNSTPSVTLAWNPVADPSVSGYNLYYGVTSGVYTNVVNAGTNLSVTLTPLARGATYVFAATSYATNGLESAYSTEVSYTVARLPGTPTNLVVRPISP